MYALLLIWAVFLLPDTWFKADALTGYLEHYALSALGLGVTLMIRCVCRGIVLGISLIALLSGGAYIVGVPIPVVKALCIGLTLCFPSLYLLSMFAAALTLKLKESTLLCMIILMPLYCMPLILLETIVMQAQMNMSWASPAYFLAAAALIVVGIFPPITVALVKHNLG